MTRTVLLTGGASGSGRARAARNAALSAESAPRGVSRDVIAAACVEGTGLFGGGLPAERRRALIEETRGGRPGTVEDVAAAAHFLAPPGARHLTGQTPHVNGGAHTTR
ncbi:hypothetical protein GCM10009759_53400 [Kitasatospora saccharophila]|uniref:Enoyl-ACP reductase-like protein n=1 Tax=Kitasatospora saccharophila TaxID=407973 RepID=A0ABN2XIJ6_9ACTN